MPDWMNDTFWVAVAFVIFFALVWRFGGFKAVLGVLDKRGEAIAKELEEAKRLRAEAQDMHAEAERRKAQAEKEAAAIIDRAQKAAQDEADAAAKELEERIARRAEAAERTIAQAEKDAEAAIRARVAQLAVEAAEDLIRSGLSTAPSKDAALKGALEKATAKLN